MNRFRVSRMIAIAGVLVSLILGVVGVLELLGSKSTATVSLTDGRLVQIENVTYGTHHLVGHRFRFLRSFSEWLPRRVADALARHPVLEMTLERPGLVVWLTVKDPKTGQYENRMLQVQLLDAHGDCYTSEAGMATGAGGNWRRGIGFTTFPRAERRLTARIVDEDDKVYLVQLRNPHVTPPANWSGQPLPQWKAVGDYEIHLLSLERRTNPPWVPQRHYFEPRWELRREGKPAEGWGEAEWITEDPVGNRGRSLGVHQPVLRFHVAFYPSVTNRELARVLASSPVAQVEAQTNQVWNARADIGVDSPMALGLFAAGAHYFSNGVPQTAPPAWWNAPTGQPSSEWSGTIRQLTPLSKEEWQVHSTEVPVVYFRLPRGESEEVRLGLRLQDRQGRYWIGNAGPTLDCADGRIGSVLIEAAPESDEWRAEVVMLKPVRAVFDVSTR